MREYVYQQKYITRSGEIKTSVARHKYQPKKHELRQDEIDSIKEQLNNNIKKKDICIQYNLSPYKLRKLIK